VNHLGTNEMLYARAKKPPAKEACPCLFAWCDGRGPTLTHDVATYIEALQ